MRQWNRNAIYISGGGFTNKGAEAMVLTVAKAVRSRLPKADIYVGVRTREVNEARAYRLIPVGEDDGRTMISRITNKVCRAWVRHACSARIDVGGYQLGDPWGDKRAWSVAKATQRSARLGSSIFFMPQAWGPFSSSQLKGAMRAVVDAATLLYVRDKTSMAAIEEAVGGRCTKVRFAHDIAWNFEGADPGIGRDLLNAAGLERETNSITVCVTPNMRVYERHQGVGQDNLYVRCLCGLVAHLCRRCNAQVVLMGHELRAGNRDRCDDRYLCNLVREVVGASLPVVHVNRVLTAGEIKAVIGNCDLLVSSRYHALIAALSQGIPAAAIGWSHKYDELLADIGLSHYSVSVTESENQLCREIDGIMARLSESAATVRTRLPEFKKSAREAVDEVVEQLLSH